MVSDDVKSRGDIRRVGCSRENACERLTLGVCMGEKAEAIANEAAVRRI